MHIEDFHQYCLSKKAVTEEFPFGPETLVFKVGGKIFALSGLDNPEFSVNLKCDPTYAEELRENYEEVQPGYHMNKKHWNTISFEGNLSEELLQKLIDHSYELVVKSLSKQKRLEFGLD
ncbi:MmcQ/YjbR family DNA-binding protein [Moheibacter stercoris]|uniref:DNA-binding protein (MmcQ/YjbR family) n=1 Tax=Moheibacter stercoris TaxID=1628251 RepID=A0ABV2LUM7_9FLAO